MLSFSLPNPMSDHLLESSQRDDSNKWSNIGFGQERCILEIKIRTLSGALHAINVRNTNNVSFLNAIIFYNSRQNQMVWPFI